MTRFAEVKARNLEKLEMYVPVVARVHGGTHPEFHEVRKVFDVLREKMQAAGTAKPDLTDEFAQLRQITGNYQVPGDVCETYEAVYTLLQELDEAYSA